MFRISLCWDENTNKSELLMAPKYFFNISLFFLIFFSPFQVHQTEVHCNQGSKDQASLFAPFETVVWRIL